MNDPDGDQLNAELTSWIATLSHEEAVRRYRALSADKRSALIEYAWSEVRKALDSGEPYGDRFESLARRFEVFAEDATGLSAEIRLKTADDLRHPDHWRAVQASQNQMSDRRLRALALASSCLADDRPDVRLRRIEEVLPELNQLASQAAAEGNLREQSAIGQDIGDLRKLREELRLRP